MKQLRTLNSVIKYSRSKIKKIKKPVAIDVLFKTTLMQIQSGQTVPLMLRFSYFYRKICKPGCGILAADETPLAMEDRFKGTVKSNTTS
jgi:hypothetical protein